MAKIRPLRAWRYNDNLGKRIESLTSPLFDVVSGRQREALYQDTYNSIHISVPKGERPHERAKETLEKWKSTGVIEQDALPGIYVYYQYFTLPGEVVERCRKGFICFINAYSWDENVILRHEGTIPHSVNDRKLILEETKMNLSPTHGLYTDQHKSIESYLDESMKDPIYVTEDYQGVRDALSVIHDHKVIEHIMNVLAEKQVILADGHHRYEGSIQYKEKMIQENKEHTGDEPYNYHLMYLTNTEADDLRILPTHRLVDGLQEFNPEEFLSALEPDFIIKPMNDAADLNQIILGKKNAFGLIIGNEAYKIRLKEGKSEEIPWDIPNVVKEIDLTVMHYFVFERVLGISRKEQASSHHISFERNFTICHNKVVKDGANFALITNGVPMESVKEVCYSGHLMPQKSTYFYPKAICGYLFGTIDQNEHDDEIDRCY